MFKGEKMDIKIIKSKKQYHSYLERMNEIFDAKKGTLEYDELDLLALVLEKYEEDKFPIKEPSPLEAIRFIMEQNNLSDEDLGKILKSRSRVTELFSSKRKLALSHIRVLHSELHIPAKTLIQEY